jgi:hypothetical protein
MKHLFQKGNTAWKKGMINGKLRPETRQKMSEVRKRNPIKYWLGKKSPHMTGVRSHFWKGGVSPENKRLRRSGEYRLWREAVFKRDNYTCIWCGDKTGGNLEADHIKPFASYPELRFAIDNGRTLCKPCHRKTSTYGNGLAKSND